MIRRLLPLWVFVTALFLSSASCAEDAAIWVALADRGGIYAETAAVLSAEVTRDTRRAEMSVAPWQELQAARPPQLIVTLGAGAFRGILDRLKREPALAGVPVLAVLLPQASYEALAPKSPNIASVTSAVFLDQPVERYFDLIRIALPDRRKVGVLLGPDSSALKSVLSRAAAARGMSLMQASPERDDIYPALRAVLADADVLLSVPDSHVFNAGSLQNILITSYRQRVPMVTFSESYVKAGAALALYTSPAQAATQAAAAVRSFFANRSLPPPRTSIGFSVATNPEVARSLGLTLDDPERLAAALRRKEEGR